MAGTKEVAQVVAAANQLTQKAAAEAVESVLAAITTVANGEKVVIRGFGTFQVKTSKATMRPNPQKPGEKVAVPARTRLTFKASK